MTSDNNRNGMSAEMSVMASTTSLANSSLNRSVQETSSLKLGEIMDCEVIQTMMEHFYRLTNIGMAIEDMSSKILVSVGWQDICAKFHRICPETLKNCIESDQQLALDVPAGTFKAYKCKNNMWDMATAIEVDGICIGNVYIGQFFFDDEEPDYEQFREQARRYGFDETEYLAALDRVPRWSKDTVDAAMAFYAEFTALISSLSNSRIQLARSLSEQHAVARQLGESEAKLSEAQEIARIGRWELDLATNNLDWSAGIYSLCEKDADSFTASFEHFIEIIHPDDRALVSDVYYDSVKNKTHYELEHRLLMPDGRIKWVIEIGRTEYDAAGNAVRSIGTVQDITDRKIQEEALQESNLRFRTLLKNVDTVAVQGYAPDGTTRYWNAASERLYGYSAQEAIGQNLLDLIIPSEMHDGVKQALQHMAQTGEAIPASELALRRKDGSIVPVYSSHTLVKVPGRETEMYCLDIDMTERKQIEGVQNFLAQTSSGTTDEPFFQTLARYLALSLGMDFVCIDRLEGGGLDARTVAVWCDGHFEDNVSYALKDTPCGDVLGQKVCCFPASVCQFFPRDQVLQDLRAESYVGVTVWNHLGQPIGLIAVIGRRPLQNRKVVEATLELVALRTAGELERLETEEALKQSDEQFRTLASLAPVGIYLTGPDGNCTYANPAWCKMAGLSLEEVRGQGWISGIHPEDRDLIVTEWNNMVQSNGKWGLEYRFLTKEGKVTLVHGLATPQYDEQGNITRYVGVNLDITERKRSEQAILESERNYREIFNATADAILIRDAETWQIVDVNQSMLLMYGYDSRDEVLRLRSGDLSANIPPYTQTAVDHYIHVAREGQTPVFEWLSRKKSGELFWSEVSMRSSQIGGNTRILVTVRDITERKQTEEEKAKLEETLQQALKMESVGRLAGGVAHDFNNMLGVILGNAQMAMEQLDPDQPLYADLKEIQAAASRSADLTRQLLAFARKQTIMPKVLNLNATIDSCLKMLERLIGEDIHLKWVPGSVKWSVKADPSQIDQMLANLCVNARDAISDVGEITIKTGTAIIDDSNTINLPGSIPGKYVWFSVSDNGCGMDQQTLAQIFEPFYTTKGVGEGTGLGLSTVYGAVQQNSGFIDVHSEPGAGTTFTIYLPRYVGEDCINDDHKSKPVERGHETILIVEDEAAILRMTTTMLKRMGYMVVAAASPNAAISLAESYDGDIHLLLTDVVMPEMNGSELAKRLKPIYPNMQCLFMSGYTSDMIAHHGKLDDGVLFIQKPFAMHDLGSKIREALD